LRKDFLKVNRKLYIPSLYSSYIMIAGTFNDIRFNREIYLGAFALLTSPAADAFVTLTYHSPLLGAAAEAAQILLGLCIMAYGGFREYRRIEEIETARMIK